MMTTEESKAMQQEMEAAIKARRLPYGLRFPFEAMSIAAETCSSIAEKRIKALEEENSGYMVQILFLEERIHDLKSKGNAPF